jgi:hypothetical protein
MSKLPAALVNDFRRSPHGGSVNDPHREIVSTGCETLKEVLE